MRATLRVSIRQPWLGMMLRGEKTVEGRRNVGAFARVQAGDVLELYDNRQPQRGHLFRVLAVQRYPGTWSAHGDPLDEFLRNHLSEALPGYTYDAARRVYESVWPSEQIKRDGMAALLLELVEGERRPRSRSRPRATERSRSRAASGAGGRSGSRRGRSPSRSSSSSRSRSRSPRGGRRSPVRMPT